ncbi:MAG: adenylate/guanylate cyclase domain-containing protein [Pseudomonadota bacterium]
MKRKGSEYLHSIWYGYFQEEMSTDLYEQIERRRLKGEKLSTVVLVSFIFSLLCLWFFSPRGHNNDHLFSTIPVVTFVYMPFLVFRLIWSFKSRVEEGAAILFAMVDIALILGALWLFPLEYGMPSSLYLKAPTFYFLYVIIALRVLSLRPGLILMTTILSGSGWVGLLVFASQDPQVQFTSSFLEYADSMKILLGAEVERLVYLLAFGSVLSVAAHGATRLMLQAVSMEGQNKKLSQFFSPEVSALIKAGDLNLELGRGYKRNTAVLMIDLRGFTTLARTMDPDSVMMLLNEYHQLVIPIISENGGVVDKFMGDGILVHFGAATKSATPSAECLKCVDEIVVAASEWAHKRQEQDLPVIEINMACAAGVCVFGATGSKNRMEMTVIGNPVNLAAKLEKYNKELGAIACTTKPLLSQAKDQGYISVYGFIDSGPQSIAGLNQKVDVMFIPRKTKRREVA